MEIEAAAHAAAFQHHTYQYVRKHKAGPVRVLPFCCLTWPRHPRFWCDMTRWIPFVTVAVFASCASKTQFNPFVTPETAVYDVARVISLAPFAEPAGLAVPDSILQLFETLIDSALSSGGFSTVPEDAYAAAWQAILEDLGGIYDPMTGQLDNEKYRVAEQRIAHEMSEQFGANAFLYPELVLVDAEFANGVAKWDGTSQSVASFWEHLGETLSALASGLSNGGYSTNYPSGTVSAVSLRVGLYDLEGSELYTNWAGIELVADKKDGTFYPDEQRFQEPERIRQSVENALGPLIHHKQTLINAKTTTEFSDAPDHPSARGTRGIASTGPTT